MSDFCRDIFIPEELPPGTPIDNLQEINNLRKIINRLSQIINVSHDYLHRRNGLIVSLGSMARRPSDGGTWLPVSDSGVYYLLPYAPSYQLRWNRRKQYVPTHDLILGYKDSKPIDFELGATILFLGILELSYIIPQKKIALVGIPRSTCGEKSAVCDSIPYIVSLSRKLHDFLPELENLELLDYSECLTRAYSINSSHLAKYSGKECSKADKLLSLEYVEKNNSGEDIAYIILDDVTTSGESMNAAHVRMWVYGSATKIYKLSLSQTLRTDA